MAYGSDTASFNYTLNTTACSDGTICPYPNNFACCSQKRGTIEIIFENSGITHNQSAADTRSTATPTSTVPKSSSSSTSAGGLSTGAGAGIGAGVAIGVCALAGLLFLVGRQILKRRRSTDQAQASTSADESKESPLNTPNAGLLPQEMGDEGQRPMSHEMALTTPSPGHKPDRVSVFSEA